MFPKETTTSWALTFRINAKWMPVVLRGRFKTWAKERKKKVGAVKLMIIAT